MDEKEHPLSGICWLTRKKCTSYWHTSIWCGNSTMMRHCVIFKMFKCYRNKHIKVSHCKMNTCMMFQTTPLAWKYTKFWHAFSESSLSCFFVFFILSTKKLGYIKHNPYYWHTSSTMPLMLLAQTLQNWVHYVKAHRNKVTSHMRKDKRKDSYKQGNITHE